LKTWTISQPVRLAISDGLYAQLHVHNGMLDQDTNSSHPALEHGETGAEDQQAADPEY
jgi:hypothetical protein